MDVCHISLKTFIYNLQNADCRVECVPLSQLYAILIPNYLFVFDVVNGSDEIVNCTENLKSSDFY